MFSLVNKYSNEVVLSSPWSLYLEVTRDWCLGYHGFKSFQELRCFNLLHPHVMKIFLTMIIKWLAVHDLTDIKVKAGTVQYSTVQFYCTLECANSTKQIQTINYCLCPVIPSTHITIFDISIIDCILQSFWSSPFLVTWKSVSKNDNTG